MTLDRALSRAGLASRTVAAQWIAAGRVQVDGRVARDPQLWVAPERQHITLDGQPLQRPQPMYWALHKPVGYLTSHGDPRGRPTIYDLLGPQLEMPGQEKRDARLGRARARPYQWYFSVGRLDQDTSGLLLITNDSVFAERVANPELKVAKTYHVRVAPPMNAATLARLGGGLDIGRDERAAPCPVRAITPPSGGSAAPDWGGGPPSRREHKRDARQSRAGARANDAWVEIVLREGKNRQVRRMVEAVGHRVEELVRVRVGKLALGDLPPGKLRRIRPADVI
jgi:pseudouridine synthase